MLLSPLELIDRIAALVAPPRVYRHRYHGVLAPNSPLSAQVTALAREATTPEAASAACPDATGESDALDQPLRSSARYLWAVLIARLFEVLPVTCPHCGAEMRLIAFITEASPVRAILAHIGEPISPPVVSPARGSPAREDTALERDSGDDSLAQPQPEFEFDQRVQW